MNPRILIVGAVAMILGGFWLFFSNQLFGSVDNNFSCSEYTVDGEKACDNVKDTTWLLLKMAPYGFIITGLFLTVGTIIGRF